MATEPPTTRPTAVEAPMRKLNAYALRFIDLLNAVNEHIWAEHDLERSTPADSGYKACLDRADGASLRVYDLLAEFTGRPVIDPTDVPLRRMSLILATLLREGSASAFRRYDERRAEIAALIACPGNNLSAARVRHMLAAADLRIARLSALSIYQQDGADIEADTATLAA